MKYLEYHFTINPLLPAREVLMAELCDFNFDSFVDTDEGLIAYILEEHKVPSLDDLIAFNMEGVNIHFEIKKSEDKNWNAEWEKNFEPIEIENLCRIRALFHSSKDGFKEEIIIQPQMSFGTGHHETTFLICKEMFELDFQDKSVLDMGCGTGILAILAVKLGANHVDAVDIDEWSYANTLENIKLNSTDGIDVFHGAKEKIKEKKYDIILANINRNILLSDMDSYADCLNENGRILFSGFYDIDVEAIESCANKLSLSREKLQLKNHWAMLQVKSI